MSGLQTHFDLEVPGVKQSVAGYHPRSMSLAAIATAALLVTSFVALFCFFAPKLANDTRDLIEDTFHRIIDVGFTRETRNIGVKQATFQSSLDARINALKYGYHQATQGAKQDVIRKTIENNVISAIKLDRADLEGRINARIDEAYDTRHAAGQDQLHQTIDARITNAFGEAQSANQECLRRHIDARIREFHRVRKTSEQDQLQQIIDARISRIIEAEQAAQLNSIHVLIDTSFREHREAQSFIQQETTGKLVDMRIGASIEAERAAEHSTPQRAVTTLVDQTHEVHGSSRQAVILHATGAQVNSMPEVELLSEDRLRDPVDSRIVQTAREPRNTASNAVVASVKMSVMIQQREGVGLVDRRNREQMHQPTLVHLASAKALSAVKTHIPADYSSGVILTSTFRISQAIDAAITALEALQLNDPGPGEVARKAMHDHFKRITGFLAEHRYSMCCGVLNILTELREDVRVALQGGVVNGGLGVQFDLLRLLREGL
ncbi:hypothetical protein LTR56_020683 [Elasticomyces elasticus]|nr:hypothetical protein LTR56_020683 [Elasticomyces elasticus]KAK3653100.1 hypothetical protein LTR22_011338 [Elasticomyces elasticus]KAK4919658.1 hypothetical protein LTR49_012722 [Elasticomyces elasticus]KAK5751245.1 hypothetical protein LTS12_018719 [Elasticomyces elasticus]